MKPIDNLYEDHRHINKALEAILRGVDAAKGGHLDVEFFEEAISFLHTYADGVHYAKEDALFEAMAGLGLPRQVGPIGWLGMEHEATRAETARMVEALALIRAGHPEAGAQLIDAAEKHVAILHGHAPKENFGFFPMADHLLPEQAQAALADEFTTIEQRVPGTMESAAEALSLRQGRPKAPAPVTMAMEGRPPEDELKAVVDSLSRQPKANAPLARVGRRSGVR